MRTLTLFILLIITACSNQTQTNESKTPEQTEVDLVAFLDTIWRTEQEPIRVRDSLGRVHGFESDEFNKQNEIYHKNHVVNEKKVIGMLEKHGWPGVDVIGDQGGLTLCNVLQHSDIAIRLKYLPMMREAVLQKKLAPRLLARAEDRIATDRGEAQVYGGQLKYYPETKTFDVWPIVDPENVDKRRAEIGLVPMAEFLEGRRRPMEWDLEKQIKRTKEFERNKNNQSN